MLFIDARHIYRQIDRAHREWTPAQIGFLANIVRLYRGEELDFTLGGDEAKAKLQEVFGKKTKYADVPGLCKAATLKEIEAQGWSLNPGRYVGVAPGEEVSDEDFKEQLETLNEELETSMPRRANWNRPSPATWRRFWRRDDSDCHSRIIVVECRAEHAVSEAPRVLRA